MKPISMKIPFTDELRKLTFELEKNKLSEELKIEYQKLVDKFDSDVVKLQEMIKQAPAYLDSNFELKPPVKKRGWDSVEENILKTNFGTKSVVEIAKLLNKSYQSVIKKVNDLNLKNSSHNWSQQEIDKLVELHARSLTDKEISFEMLLPEKDIQSKITELKNQGNLIMRGQNRLSKAPVPAQKEKEITDEDFFSDDKK